MKKNWTNPHCTTLTAKSLSKQIQAAAWSSEWVCRFGNFR